MSTERTTTYSRCAAWLASVSGSTLRRIVIAGCALFWVLVIYLIAF